MSLVDSTTCYGCGATLVYEGLPPGAIVLCARCRAPAPTFSPFGPDPLSAKAVIGFALGALSLLGGLLTGLPAVALGVWALRDIRRAKGRRRGRGFAFAAIALGSFFGMTCGVYQLSLGVALWQMSRSAPPAPPVDVFVDQKSNVAE